MPAFSTGASSYSGGHPAASCQCDQDRDKKILFWVSLFTKFLMQETKETQDENEEVVNLFEKAGNIPALGGDDFPVKGLTASISI